MSTLVADLLRARLRSAGADPLITYYDVARGERIELSAITVANWVAKVANLLSWEVSVAPGDPVALPLARTAPGHWMTAVWQVALWQVGASVDLTGGDDAALLVCGPEWTDHADAGVDVLACSLHPFATGLGPEVPSWVTDVDLAVRAQPDSFTATRVDPAATAWTDGDRRLTQSELAAGPASSERSLLVPTDPWSTARDGVVAALLGGGSVVTVVGGTPDDHRRIAAEERVSHHEPRASLEADRALTSSARMNGA